MLDRIINNDDFFVFKKFIDILVEKNGYFLM